ncbi:PaaI family thioesterase [Nocardia jiangxiensis]|uniref:PaaI family thioesterase n=1 Tax=Nocardia jiangxiensis TaxID=282685 RepID=A0ABW6SFS6_9NOCA
MHNGMLGRIGQLLGLNITVAKCDRVVLTFDVRPDLLQPYEIVQGGIYCAAIEAAASLGADLWLGERGRVVGVNNTTDFLHAVKSGTLSVTATPLLQEQLQQLWLVEVEDESDRSVARGQVRLQNLI